MGALAFYGTKYHRATGDVPTTPPTVVPGFFERNKKVILIAGVVVIAGLLFIPDVYLRKYVPWVK
jgi:hypothetical protein